MFKKPFKVKNNTQLKESVRKKFRSEVLKQFPNLSEESLSECMPNKETIFSLKILTHNGEVVVLYCVQKLPIIFEIESVMYPTVYMLWHFPDLLPVFTTNTRVFPFLVGGADLMLPGVVLEEPVAISSYGRLNKGDRVCINLNDNRAPIAVGKAAQSSVDMYMSARRGKCVTVLHCHGDFLSNFDKLLSIPDFGPVVFKSGSGIQETNSNADSELAERSENLKISENSKPCEEPVTAVVDEDVGGGDDGAEGDIEEELPEDEKADSMDELLAFCFLKSIKTTAKNIDLPLLTSNFYKLHILAACPEGKSLDIKKTKYKKLSNFLQEMCETGLISLETITKGVQAISTIQYKHELLKEFSEKYPFEEISNDLGTKKQIPSNVAPSGPEVVEMHTVCAAVLPFFSLYSCRKGDSLSKDQVRKYITDYVKVNNLRDPDNKGLVVLDLLLHNIVRGNLTVVNWEFLIKGVIHRMGLSCQMSTGSNRPVTVKGKLPPIDIQIGSRTGNKKVTLVNNLELYGINLKEFSQECQHGVAASTKINRPEDIGLKSTQVQIQGNQTLFVGKLLMEKYQISKKFIRGLENVPKKKK